MAINVYNIQRQIVASFNKQHDSGGHYYIEFGVQGMAAGIYFYSLEGKGYYEVKKMILLN